MYLFPNSVQFRRTRMNKWKWLLVNGVESRISLVTEYSNHCRDGSRALVCSGICWKIVMIKWINEIYRSSNSISFPFLLNGPCINSWGIRHKCLNFTFFSYNNHLNNLQFVRERRKEKEVELKETDSPKQAKKNDLGRVCSFGAGKYLRFKTVQF